jgi:hypothetical protein
VSRYRFIEVEKVNHAVRTLCRVLQVSSRSVARAGRSRASSDALRCGASVVTTLSVGDDDLTIVPLRI